MLLGFGTGGLVSMVSMILADGSEWLKLLFSGVWGPLVGLNEDRGLRFCPYRHFLSFMYVFGWKKYSGWERDKLVFVSDIPKASPKAGG